MLDLIRKINELKIPVIVIIGGVFLIFIAFLIKKAFQYKYHGLFARLLSLGISLLIILFTMGANIPWAQNFDYLQTKIYNPQKQQQGVKKQILLSKNIPQKLNFNKTNNTLNISDGNTVNLSTLVKEYKAGEGLQLNDRTFSLTNKGSEGTYGSKTKIPQIKVDKQGRILDITEKTVDFTDTVLTEQEVDDYVANNGYLLVEVDGSATNELNTNFFLSGDNLTVSDQGGDLTVDLSKYISNTESIDELGDVDTITVPPSNGSVLTWNSASSNWEAGSPSAGNTDNQQISLNGATNILTLSNGTGADTTVDLTPYLDNTDDQTADVFNIQSNILHLSLEDDGQADYTVDLSPYLDNTDAQALSFNTGTNILSLTNGGTVDLSSLNDEYTAGTGLALSGANVFSLNSGIDNLTDVDTTTTAPTNGQVLSWDGANWVPASTSSLETVTNIANTIAGHKIADYTNESGAVQNINETITSLALNGNSLDYTAEDGATTNINLSGYLDNTDDQTADVFNIQSNILHLSLEDDGQADYTVDLSPYLDNTDAQALSFNTGTNILSLTNGGTVDLSSLNDEYIAGNGLNLSGGNQFYINSPTCAGTDKLQWNGSAFVCSADVDTDTTYTAGTGLSLTGTTFALSAGIDLLSDVDTTTTAPTNGDLLSWDGTNWVTTSATNYTNNIYTADGTLAGNRTVALNGNDLYFTGSGNVGIGTTSPVNKLQVNGNVRATRFVASNGTAGSPAFRFDSDSDTGMFRATTNQLAFTTGGNERVRIDNNGRVGIGTSVPDSQLQVNGNAHINRDLKVEDSTIIYTKHDYKDEGLNGEILNWNLLQTEKTDDPNNPDFATITSGTGYKQTFPITRWKIGDEGSNGQHYGYVGYFPESMAHDGAFRVNTAGHEETDLVLGVGTKDVVYIDNHNFYVGLGTDAPDQLLDVAGNMRLQNAFYDRNNQSGTAGQILSSTVNGTDWIDASGLALGSIDNHSDVDTSTIAPTNGDLLSWDGANWVTTSATNYTNNIYTADGTLTGNRVVDLNNQNLTFDNAGIGVGEIHIQNGLRWLELGNTGTVSYIGSAYGGSSSNAHPLAFRVSDIEYIRIDTNGNVGIGDTTPDALLDVAGSFRLDGTFADASGDVGTAGQILSSTVVGTDWINASSLALGSIDNHSDVDTTTTAPTNGQVLSWDGANWVPASTSSLETVTNIANTITGHKIADYTNESGTVQNINETITSLALNGNSLDYTAEDGATTNINLSGYLDNTDDQTADVFNIQSNILHLSLEDDGQADYTVDLSPYLDNTDAQALSFNTGTNILSLTNGGTVDLSSLNDEYSAGTGLALSGANVFSLNSGIDNLTDVDTTTTPPSNGDLLTWDGANWVTTSPTNYTNNIYTADGTLTGNRTVSLNGNDLYFVGSGNVGIGTNSPLSRFDIANHIAFDRGDGNVANGSDIWFDAQGLLSSDSNMLFNIDADNNSISEYFKWSNNSDSTTGATELMRLTEGLGLDVANHEAIGANANIVNTQTLRVAENYNLDATTHQIVSSATVTSPTLTADRISYGGYYYLTNNKTEDTANGFDSDAMAVYGFTQTTGTNTFRYNRGGLFEARNASNATANIGYLHGVTGIARQYATDDSADVPSMVGVYGQALGYSGGSSSAGDVSVAYAIYGNTYAYSSDISSAYGVYGYTATNNGRSGDINSAYGIRGQVRVDSDDGGDIQHGYAGYFTATKRFGANNMIDATAIYANATAANTAYAGRFYATSTDAVINYGLYVSATNASVDNYGIYGEQGDWLLDEDGDGIAGGTGPGGDLFLGESQDLAIYHNGTNSYIQNNTGDLIINGNNHTHNLIINNFDLIGIGTVSPSYDIDVDRTGTNPNRSARLRLRGSSSGYTNAALILQAATDTNYRGLGVLMHDEGGDTEWFAGRPYADSDKYIIARLDSVANVDESVAQTSNALLTVQNDGSVGIGISSPTDTLHIAGSLRVEGALKDNNNSAGTTGQVLTATTTGFEWQNPTSCVMGGAKVQGNGTVTNSYGIISSVSRTNTGRYTVNFSQSVNTDDYYVHLSKEESTSTRDDVNIDVSAYNTNNVQVIIHEGDNGTAANVYRDRAFSITIFDANCTALSAVTSSDRRLKRNIENIEPETALGKVLKLQGVSYKWDTTNHPFRRGMDNKPEIGFIAQDVQKVLPEVVNVEKDGYLSLEYGKIMAVTVEAIKDIWGNVENNQQNIVDIQQDIQEMKEERKQLSDNITTLTDLTTQITTTLENHEQRIAELENKLADLNIGTISDTQNIGENDNSQVKNAMQSFAENLKVIKKDGEEISFDIEGNLTVKELTAEKITTGEIVIDNKNNEEGEQSVGKVIISAGEISARIESKLVNDKSHIILTPHQPVVVGLGKIKDGKSFEIELKEALDKDLEVEWLIVLEK